MKDADLYRSGASKTAHPKAVKTASVAKVKCTYYLPSECVELLEDERHRRRKAGDRADLSGLVAEAVRTTYGGRSFDEDADAFLKGMKRDKKR